MKPINRTLLAATLVAAPLLLASSEVVRKYVALGRSTQGTRSSTRATRSCRSPPTQDLWLLHSYLTLLGVLAWLGAMIAITAAIRARRPVLGTVGGILGLGSAIGYAAHLGFYTIPLGVSAGMAEQDLNAAATVWVAGDGDPFTRSDGAVLHHDHGPRPARARPGAVACPSRPMVGGCVSAALGGVEPRAGLESALGVGHAASADPVPLHRGQ